MKKNGILALLSKIEKAHFASIEATNDYHLHVATPKGTKALDRADKAEEVFSSSIRDIRHALLDIGIK